MKSFFLICLFFWTITGYGQDSIEVRFVTTERNVKFKITRFGSFYNNILVDTFIISKKAKTYKTYLPKDSIIFNDKLRVYLWVKRKYWIGWQRFWIADESEYNPANRVLSIYKSFEHKRRFRYIHAWKSVYILD